MLESSASLVSVVLWCAAAEAFGKATLCSDLGIPKLIRYT